MSRDLSNSELFSAISKLIDESRLAVARKVNEAMSLLYWRVGILIRKDVLNSQRAEYGKQIINTLAAQLTTDYGSG